MFNFWSLANYRNDEKYWEDVERRQTLQIFEGKRKIAELEHSLKILSESSTQSENELRQKNADLEAKLQEVTASHESARNRCQDLEERLKESKENAVKSEIKSRRKIAALETKLMEITADQEFAHMRFEELQAQIKALSQKKAEADANIVKLEARFNLTELANESVKRRLLDAEKRHESEVKMLEASRDKAIADRNAAEHHARHLQKLLEVAQRNANWRIFELETHQIAIEVEANEKAQQMDKKPKERIGELENKSKKFEQTKRHGVLAGLFH